MKIVNALLGLFILALAIIAFTPQSSLRALAQVVTPTVTVTDTPTGTITPTFTPTPTATPTPTLTPTPTPIPGFIETGGTVVFEGEHFDSNISRNNHTWTNGSDANAVGATFINTKNDGLIFTPPNSAETQYLINFSTTGTYYVWLRGYAPSGSSNAIGVGLDGAPTTTPVNWQATGSWVWDDTDLNGATVKINVASAGAHMFSIWERKDGTKLDRIVLSTSPTKPTGTGPAESQRNIIPTPTPSLTITPSPTATPTPTLTSTPTPTLPPPTPTPVPGKSTMNLESIYSFNVNLRFGDSNTSPRITVNDETVVITNKSNDKVSTLNFSVLPKAFGEFDLTSVTDINGNNLDYSWTSSPSITDNSNLAVNLPDYLDPDAQTTVKISFVLNPTGNTSTYLDALLSKANGIMEVGNWFPILSDGHGMRMPGDSQNTVTADKFHIDLTMDGNYPVAAPGSVTQNGNNVTIDFKQARNFAFMVCPGCSVTKDDTSINGVTVKVFSLSSTLGVTARKYAVAALKTMNSRFATNYPYDTFVVAQASGPAKSANEFPGLIFVGGAWLDSQVTVAHEVAHQWFYGMLGNDQMNDPWVDEAFAEWAGRGFTGRNYCSGKLVSSRIYDFPNAYDYSNDGTCGSYVQTIYLKGAYFIDQVRTKMGENAFWTSMDKLFADHKFGVITTADVAQNWIDNYPGTSTQKTAFKNWMQNNYINW